jgi:hypothetical protein
MGKYDAFHGLREAEVEVGNSARAQRSAAKALKKVQTVANNWP